MVFICTIVSFEMSLDYGIGSIEMVISVFRQTQEKGTDFLNFAKLLLPVLWFRPTVFANKILGYLSVFLFVCFVFLALHNSSFFIS